MKKLVFAALVSIAGLLGWLSVAPFVDRQVIQAALPPLPPGILAPQEPVQMTLKPPLMFEKDGYRLTALATYDITARLLARQSYRWDREAELSPFDFALGWNYMSDSSVLDRIEISQSTRFYWWRTEDPAIDLARAARDSANVHLIPASRAVRRQLDRLPVGSLIHLRGYLVRVEGADGWQWQSSMTRDDTGRGACELIWVTSVERVK